MGRKKYSKELKARIAGSIMEFNFSTNNSMTEFETLDTSSTIYLGFASQPETNIFSQKYFRSPHASTTESLIKKLELLERPKKRNLKS